MERDGGRAQYDTDEDEICRDILKLDEERRNLLFINDLLHSIVFDSQLPSQP